MVDRKGDGSLPPPILRKGYRVICSIASVIFATLGVVAVFVTGNQVGTGGLLLIATLLFLVAVNGRLPVKLQVGDKSIEFLSETLANTVQNLPTEVASGVIERVEREVADEDRHEIRDAISRYQKYEEEIRSLLSAAISDFNNSHRSRPSYNFNEQQAARTGHLSFRWIF